MRLNLTSSFFGILCAALLAGCSTTDAGGSAGTEGSTSGEGTSTGGTAPTTSSTGSAGTTTTEGSGTATGSTSSASDPTTGEPGTTTTEPGTTTTDPGTTGDVGTTGEPGSTGGVDTTGGSTTGEPGLCPPMPGDDACAMCNKESCCDQIVACLANMKCTCFFACVNGGMAPQQCAQTCMIGQPGQNPAIAGLFECSNANCDPQCG